MPIFERPPLDTLTPAKDRWTPIYLERGRLEVDDSSIKWIGADGLIAPLPVASLSALILGPGSTITHAAVKACAQCNCPVFWMGEDGMHFYSFGIAPNHSNSMARQHAQAWATPRQRSEIARRMFLQRFPEASVHGVSIKQLRGMEGRRVKAVYADLGKKFGVTWKGRNYNPSNWDLSDGVNRALSTANGSLYALTAAVCCSMGFVPQLGFVHQAGTLPFIYDIADLYKHETSWSSAFEAASLDPNPPSSLVRRILKKNIEESRLLRRMPVDLKKLFDDLPGNPPSEVAPHPLQPRT
ncbi:type I-E CRISPR-associated endonuclease Cas1e [Roseibacillus persicicus]|uniref:type I-E CRISPR-associated endonuclease Cas1e n=1 Tax=Roseibacillus persicicus TaxID=454148 RepID=UPI00280CF7D4|nr:type I-E CRISPR-associated endonuclease Cas1e [Roseibacillus persicicus]MDQ8189669.1 type I-E CRISPR-associated endonuclease Cas1e [Roseibacillus persicicus]